MEDRTGYAETDNIDLYRATLMVKYLGPTELIWGVPLAAGPPLLLLSIAKAGWWNITNFSQPNHQCHPVPCSSFLGPLCLEVITIRVIRIFQLLLRDPKLRFLGLSA